MAHSSCTTALGDLHTFIPTHKHVHIIKRIDLKKKPFIHIFLKWERVFIYLLFCVYVGGTLYLGDSGWSLQTGLVMRLGWFDCWQAKMATWYLTLFHLFIFNSLNSVNSLAFLPLLMLLKTDLWQQWDGSESKRCLLWNLITWTEMPRTHIDVWLAQVVFWLFVCMCMNTYRCM